MKNWFFLRVPAALDAIVSPTDYIRYTPLGTVLAGILIAAVAAVTFLLIRRFYGKKKK